MFGAYLLIVQKVIYEIYVLIRGQKALKLDLTRLKQNVLSLLQMANNGFQ